jgi:hypothetical protein
MGSAALFSAEMIARAAASNAGRFVVAPACAILAGMGGATWRDVWRDEALSEQYAELFDELERSGWYARTRMGDSGIRFWPDGARAKQIVIDTRLRLNPHRLSMWREHTGLDLVIEIEEGGK